MSRLQLVDIDHICFHEPIEPKRLVRTCQAIEREGVIRHPIIATYISGNKYLILDGAHRTRSLQQLGCKKIPIQLVDESEITMEAWTHLLPKGPWLKQLKKKTTFHWSDTALSDYPVAELLYADKTSSYIYPSNSFGDTWTRLETWNELVSLYTQDQSVIRLPQRRYYFPGPNHILFQFPTLTLGEIKEIVLAGRMVPAGVTRCIIQGRLLNLQIPLCLLTSSSGMNEWIQFCERKADKLRLYTESIYLCEI